MSPILSISLLLCIITLWGALFVLYLIKGAIAYSRNRSFQLPSRSLSFLFTISLLTIPTTFYFREPLLGLDLFYVPSGSMKPALIPGDIVMVDTKHYDRTKLMKNDIVVFYHDKYEMNFVKRIKNTSENRFTVVGDNIRETISIDQIGVINNQALKGKVTAVLINTRHFCSHPRVLREVK
ncbi:MAG: S26 family signal peptidase [Kangiellaceae bacterium]|nr:S26 family signal peptidase [Kangiellaceae bacterium]